MGKCVANADVRSIVVSGGGRRQLKLWSASFRRILLDSVRCGGRYDQTSETESEYKWNDDNDLMRLRSEFKKENAYGSDKLLDLLRLSESSEEEELAAAVKRKAEVLEELKRVVNKLQAGGVEVLEGAKEVRRLSKDDSSARATLAMLGAIPPLVGLLDSPDLNFQIAALYALLNLGVGNDENKSAIVKAGAIHKMLKLIESTDATLGKAVAEAIVANFLALSALDANKPIIGLSGALPFLVRILLDPDIMYYDLQAKQDALGALYNLSISSPNVSPLLETNVVPFFLSNLGDMDMSERILAILGNIVSIPEGRKAISSVPDAFPILIDVLNWTDSPGCQEKVSYILMVMAHKAFKDRRSMIEAGIMPSLLELTLLGTTLSQKRASRILECLTIDKGKQISESCSGGGGGGGGFSPALSAPLSTSKCSSSTCMNHELIFDSLMEDYQMMSEERKAVKQLVEQSLQSNMKRIAKRANLELDFVPSDHLKAALTSSSTSKSLPF